MDTCVTPTAVLCLHRLCCESAYPVLRFAGQPSVGCADSCGQLKREGRHVIVCCAELSIQSCCCFRQAGRCSIFVMQLLLRTWTLQKPFPSQVWHGCLLLYPADNLPFALLGLVAVCGCWIGVGWGS